MNPVCTFTERRYYATRVFNLHDDRIVGLEFTKRGKKRFEISYKLSALEPRPNRVWTSDDRISGYIFLALLLSFFLMVLIAKVFSIYDVSGWLYCSVLSPVLIPVLIWKLFDRRVEHAQFIAMSGQAAVIEICDFGKTNEEYVRFVAAVSEAIERAQAPALPAGSKL